MTEPGGDFYEFGPFRLEVPSRSLYRAGDYVPVTPKAFDTLLLLVEEAGRVVTKEELLQRVWPDAFVEEGSIANNISLLRKILNPYYRDEDGPIATVARRGYRFTAPVTLRNATAGISVVADAGPLDADALKAIEAFDSAPVLPPAQTSRLWRVTVLIASIAVVLVVGIGTLRIATSEARAGTAPVRRAVAVLSMTNLSGSDDHGWMATALAESINTELGAGGQLRLVSGAAVAQMQQDMSPQPGVGLSRKQLDEIGKNLGADLILTGSYLMSNGRVRVDMRLDDIASGSPVASLSMSEDESKLIDLVAAASRELRSTMGLAPALPGQTASARAALSSNPAALRYYFVGLDALRIHDVARSVELLTQAVAEDPQFALAHSVLSISWRVLGQDGKSQEEAKKAFALAGKLSREDQLAVEGAYYEVMSDWPAAIEKYQSLWNFFPDNIAYAMKLSYMQLAAGRLDEARRTLDQMRALPPPADTDPRVDKIEADWLFRQGRFADVVTASARGAANARLRKSNQLLATALDTQGRGALRVGDIDKARALFVEAQQLYEALGDQAGVAEVLRADGYALQTRGELDAAQKRLDEAFVIATRINYQRLIPEIRIIRSDIERLRGDFAHAYADAEAALALVTEGRNRAGMVRALTALGFAETEQRGHRRARMHLEEAARLGREVGEPSIFTAAVNALANLDLAEGRVDDARRKIDEILPLDRRSGDKSALATRLATSSAILRAQSQLDEARKATTEECAIHESLGARTLLSACRQKLAELAPGLELASNARGRR